MRCCNDERAVTFNRTIGAKELTGLALVLDGSTSVVTLYSPSGLLMCRVGDSLQQLANAAVKGPLEP